MAELSIGLGKVLLGLGNIGAGVGFGVAEKEKMNELDSKAKKLKQDVDKASDLYDEVYYRVAVNLDRVKKALDKLPSDFLDKVNEQIARDTSASNAEQAVNTLGKVFGYTKNTLKVASGLLQIVRYCRQSKAEGDEPTTEPLPDPFEPVPLNGEEPPVVPEAESSFSSTPTLDKIITGLNIAGIVFGLAGLATTIGLGVWTLDNLDKAINDVDKKQKQIKQYQKAMTAALNQIAAEAGLPPNSYTQLTTLAATWEEISAEFDSYQKVLNYAVQGYFQDRPLKDIKAKVNAESDPGTSFPDDGYPLAETLADDIRQLFQQGKTDKEIVSYFANDNPNISQRFVFEEYFISTLRK